MNLQRRDAKSKQLTNEQRHGILQQLLQYTKNKEKLEHAAINKVAVSLIMIILLLQVLPVVRIFNLSYNHQIVLISRFGIF